MSEASGVSCVAVGSGPPMAVLSFLPDAGDPAGLTWRYLRRVLRRDHSDAATMLSAEDGFDLRGRLHDITAPTLLIHGERDVIYPMDLARETADGVPDARLMTYEGRTHAGTLRDPRFPADTLAFLTANG